MNQAFSRKGSVSSSGSGNGGKHKDAPMRDERVPHRYTAVYVVGGRVLV